MADATTSVTPVTPVTQDFKTMSELLASGGIEIKVPKVGDVLEGTILSAGKNEIYVDIEGIGLGVVRGRELYDESIRLQALKAGDKLKTRMATSSCRSGKPARSESGQH
jgi:ribosomal protein S1